MPRIHLAQQHSERLLLTVCPGEEVCDCASDESHTSYTFRAEPPRQYEIKGGAHLLDASGHLVPVVSEAGEPVYACTPAEHAATCAREALVLHTASLPEPVHIPHLVGMRLAQ